MKGLVSILIPVFNREDFIAQTIQSALNQTYSNIEIIVVDNASTDSTWSEVQRIAKLDSRIKPFQNEANIGPVRNWRRCVDEATGLFGKILWSDDLIASNFVEKCLELMDPDTAFVYSSVRLFKENSDSGVTLYTSGATGHKESGHYIRNALFGSGVPVSPGCALFRMGDLRNYLFVDIPNKVGSDFSMHAIGNDLLLFLMTAKDYRNYGIISEPLALFRHHTGSITVSSSEARLAVHYSMVRAYFCENHYQSELNRMVAFVWLLLKRYPESRSFNVYSLDDFFHCHVSVRFRYFLLLMYSRIAGLPKRVVRKFRRIIGGV